MNTDLIPLQYLDRNEYAEVADVEGDPCWVCRMAELGLRPGARLRMLQPGCPCLLEIGQCRLSMRLDNTVHVLVRSLPRAAHLCEAV